MGPSYRASWLFVRPPRDGRSQQFRCAPDHRRRSRKRKGALEGKADRVKAGVVRIAGLEEYVYDRVKALTGGKQKPMVAKPKMVENFPIVVVSN
jgi:hypothetical protein